MGKISDLLKVIPDQEKRYVKISMDLSTQISYYLTEKVWLQADLARELNKSESEVSKWLSGPHNFTVKTLALIESVLEKDLFIIPLDINRNLNESAHPVMKHTQTSVLNFQDILTLVKSFDFEITPNMESYTDNETTSKKNSVSKHKIDNTNFIAYNIS